MTYAEFIDSKAKAHKGNGIEVADIHESLFPFQSAITRWTLNKGRSCLFAGTGLGKTRMQCEFSRHMPSGYRFILAPLAVAGQTIEEAKEALNMDIVRVYESKDVSRESVNILNYDRLHVIEGFKPTSVALDESSILKSHDGAYRRAIQEFFYHTDYKLACTATPSPNDYTELGTHSEFIGAMSRLEMFATFFTHDGGDTSKWRLKKHAQGDFWRWLSTWAVVLQHPRDIGYDMPGYDLPPLNIRDHTVTVASSVAGGLFGDGAISATELYPALRESTNERAEMVRYIVDADPGDWLIWVYTDEDQRAIERILPGIASVKGPDPDHVKEDRLLGFASGKYDSLVTKPRIGGFGMNWQRTHKQIFNGLTHSFEQVYQCIRRQWRFGQKSPVDVHMVTCNALETVRTTQAVKQQAFLNMGQEMAKYCIQEVSR